MGIITAIVVCACRCEAHVLQLLDVDNWQKHKHLTGFSSYFLLLSTCSTHHRRGVFQRDFCSRKNIKIFYASRTLKISFILKKRINTSFWWSNTLWKKMEILRSSHIHVSHIYSTGYLHLWLNKHRHQMATSDCLIKAFFFCCLSTRLFHKYIYRKRMSVLFMDTWY